MIKLEHESARNDKVLGSIVNGVAGGMLGVLAIGVWAVNFEAVVTGQAGGGMVGLLARVLLCEAIPLATLCAVHNGIGTNENTEKILRRVVGTIYHYCGGFLIRRDGKATG